MPKELGPKSNANRRNRATRRADRIANIPALSQINYAASSGTLHIDLDFNKTRLPSEEEETFDTLVKTLPRYANETDIINLKMIFKPSDWDVEGADRHDILTRVVQIINKFPRIKAIQFTLVLDHFNWKQISSASSIYGLDFVNWTFDLDIKKREIQHILANSSLDRRLRAAEKRLHRQAM